MAPIDPKQLLVAFSPLLTRTGGIKKVEEVPKLSSLMKKFSRKLVSRCIYCNVLLNTDPQILEVFLQSGGWETIHSWVKGAKDTDNNPFLAQILQLLLVLPMTVERLKENDTPKIVKSLVKSEDELISTKAKQVKENWMNLLTGGNGNEQVKVVNKNKDKTKKRKREKEKEKNNQNQEQKDVKINGIPNDKTNEIQDSPKDVLSPKKLKIVELDGSLTTVNQNVVLIPNQQKPTEKILERQLKPETARIKMGKSRLDAFVSEFTPQKPPTKKIKQVKPNPLAPKNPLDKDKTKELKIEVKPENKIEVKTEIKCSSLSSPKAHTLHDCAGFIDALIAPTSTDKVKKKRRTSNSTTGTSSGDISPTKTTNTISFYKDTLQDSEERMDDNHDSNASNNSSKDESTNESDEINKKSDEINKKSDEVPIEDIHMNVDVDINIDPIPTSSSIDQQSNANQSPTNNTAIKPILMLTKRRGREKKSIKWADDQNLTKIRYFELDENERVNVTRPAGADMKRFDMKHEGMQLKRRGPDGFDEHRCEDRAPYKLVAIDIPSEMQTTEIGKDSKEKYVQADRQKTSLESFYGRDQIPDNPMEPDYEVFNLSNEPPKNIPLEDQSNPNNVYDYSTVEYAKKNDPNAISFHPFHSNHFSSQIPPFTATNQPNIHLFQSQVNPFVAPTNTFGIQIDPFVRPNLPGPQFNNQSPWMNQNQFNSGVQQGLLPQPSQPRQPVSFQLRPSGHQIHNNNNKNQKPICKFFRQGNCKFQNCNFAHIRSDNLKDNT